MVSSSESNIVFLFNDIWCEKKGKIMYQVVIQTSIYSFVAIPTTLY